MTLARLQVTDLRCLQNVVVDLDSSFTLICGPNASGKTSLLEAIYVLGRGRSFRTRRLEHLIRRGTDRFVIFGEASTPDRLVPIGVEGSKLGVRARIGGVSAASLAELALAMPVQIVDPEVHKLIEDSPARRRRFMDWGVFHVEPQFVGHWQRFQQALKQRNAALKSRQPRAVTAAWDHDLLDFGELLSQARSQYVQRLREQAQKVGSELLGMDVDLQYRSGWAAGLSYAEALRQSWNTDQDRGVTQVGPHRADLSVHINGVLARDMVSRGQQKLLAAALLIAQLRLFPAESVVRPSLLLDDPAAELDDERLTRLIGEVAGQGMQLVVTTLHAGFAAFGAPGRSYRIREGQLAEG